MFIGTVVIIIYIIKYFTGMFKNKEELDLTLSIREWTCPSCDEIHDRDFNASKNILKQGLKILSGSGIESDIKQKQVEALPLGESMKPETH